MATPSGTPRRAQARAPTSDIASSRPTCREDGTGGDCRRAAGGDDPDLRLHCAAITDLFGRSVFERSGDAALLATFVAAVVLLLAAWRRSGQLMLLGVALPAATLTVHLLTIPSHDRHEQQCRRRSLKQALQHCGEKLDRYLVARGRAGIELTPRPDVPADERFICFARWAQWGEAISWTDAAMSAR